MVALPRPYILIEKPWLLAVRLAQKPMRTRGTNQLTRDSILVPSFCICMQLSLQGWLISRGARDDTATTLDNLAMHCELGRIWAYEPLEELWTEAPQLSSPERHAGSCCHT
mmetsp:Transcript_48626/g.103699  ORF Transcript_48626/g.103699 Transcript_48626/m.103699 type:complete len:111 (-) Transcript_48626:80-412(-)